jgi:hypothetical protein
MAQGAQNLKILDLIMGGDLTYDGGLHYYIVTMCCILHERLV